MKILIVSGGNTSERKISLLSARSVQTALEKNGYQVKMFDLNKGYETLKKIHQDCAVIFPVLHGKEGEDGKLYKFLKLLNKPFIGADHQGSKIAFHKILHKKYLDKNDISTARWQIIKNTQDIIKFGFPCVLKAAQGGSSKEVAFLTSVQDLKTTRVRKILNLSDEFYVEEILKGTEITASILHKQALPLVEIVPPPGQWFDYKNKYSGQAREIPHATSLKEEVKKLAQDLALKIHSDLKLGTHSRTDMIIINNKPFVLETNTPNGVGFTQGSLFPKAALAAGINFECLTKRLINLALKDGKTPKENVKLSKRNFFY